METQKESDWEHHIGRAEGLFRNHVAHFVFLVHEHFDACFIEVKKTSIWAAA